MTTVLDLTAGRWVRPGGRRVLEMAVPTQVVPPSSGAWKSDAAATAEAAVRAWCGDPAPSAPVELSDASEARLRREVEAAVERYGPGGSGPVATVEMFG